MAEIENKKINKIEKLVEVIAVNVFKLTEDMGQVKKDVGELKESNKNIRNDILNLGDRFVSYHMFDQLSSRVSTLEKKNK